MDKPPSRTTGASQPALVDLAELYRAHTDSTRLHLRRFGVLEQDLDDLLQEVFLVLHAKRDVVAHVAPLDPWLREVCRRVAAGDRRRAHRRREIAFGVPPERADELRFDQALEQGEDEERLHRALGRLDEQSRDLVALHELGNLPLVNVAELLDADRKTVRKRLSTALRRLTTLLRDEPVLHSRSTDGERAGEEAARSSEGFRSLALHPAIRIGRVGGVVIAVWSGPATVEALELLDTQFERALSACGQGFAYLAVVEASTRPPDLRARQKIVAMLEAHARHIRVYATAIEGGGAWIVRPIMTGLSLLARPPFPMQFFNGLQAAARWLADSHPALSQATAAQIIESAEQLRDA